MKIGDLMQVKPSEFLGTPGTEAVVVRILQDSITKEELYLVLEPNAPRDFGEFVVAADGTVMIGPPHSTAEYTRAP